jgi:hypothetical protein
VNTSVSVSDYKYDLTTNQLDQLSFGLGSHHHGREREPIFWYANDRHSLKIGARLTRHQFGVGRLQITRRSRQHQYRFQHSVAGLGGTHQR